MRTLRKNKQRMFYSLYKSAEPIYEKDEYGNIKYMEIDGVQVPIEVGTREPHYDTPIEFKANIYSELNEMHLKSYGVDQSSIYSEIVVEKGKLPLKIGTIIWRESEIIYEDEEQTTPNQSSADYTVVGIMTEGLNTDAYLLQRNSSESDNNG
jgi:hypothetical protein